MSLSTGYRLLLLGKNPYRNPRRFSNPSFYRPCLRPTPRPSNYRTCSIFQKSNLLAPCRTRSRSRASRARYPLLTSSESTPPPLLYPFPPHRTLSRTCTATKTFSPAFPVKNYHSLAPRSRLTSRSIPSHLLLLLRTSRQLSSSHDPLFYWSMARTFRHSNLRPMGVDRSTRLTRTTHRNPSLVDSSNRRIYGRNSSAHLSLAYPSIRKDRTRSRSHPRLRTSGSRPLSPIPICRNSRRAAKTYIRFRSPLMPGRARPHCSPQLLPTGRRRIKIRFSILWSTPFYDCPYSPSHPPPSRIATPTRKVDP